jgi:hypothetical protein
MISASPPCGRPDDDNATEFSPFCASNGKISSPRNNAASGQQACLPSPAVLRSNDKNKTITMPTTAT